MRERIYRSIREFIIISCFLLTGLFGFCAVHAEDLEMVAPMEEASGYYLPRAGVESVSGSGRRRLQSLYLSDFSFKEQLENANQRAIYQAIESTVNLVEYVDNFRVNASGTKTRIGISAVLAQRVELAAGVTTTDYSQDAAYLELYRDFTKATHAYRVDHLEKYWIKNFGFSITATDVKNGYIDKIKVWPNAYYDGILSEVAETDIRLRECAASVKGDSLYEKVKYIHDYICEQITYKGSENDYAHTVPCAWLESYGHSGVCEAYAKSFACVCELAGIEAVTVTGGSKMDGDSVKADHMWNYVRMENGQWYLVDCTWDRAELTGEVSYRYFLKGKEASGNHMAVGCFSPRESTTPTYEPFSYPALAEETYPAIYKILPVEDVVVDIDTKISLTVDYLPKQATKGTEFIYESSDTQIVKTMNDGSLMAVAPGEVKVTIRSKEYKSLTSVCHVVVREHEFTEEKEIIPPNCVEEGKKIMACVHEGCKATKEIPIPALGHDEKIYPVEEATCTTTGKTEGKECNRCGEILEEQEEIPALGHDEKILPAEEATCTTTGKTGGKGCNRCSEILEEQEEIPALGHDEKVLASEEATCTTAGKTEGKKCIRCDKVLVEQTVIPEGHVKVVTKEAVAPTVLLSGCTEGSCCSRCGEVLSESKELEKLPSKITLIGKSIPMQFAKKLNAKKLIKSMTNGDSLVSVSSKNTKYIKISGKTTLVATKKAGSSLVTLTFASGKTATITVKSQKAVVATTGLTVPKAAYTIGIGKTEKVIPTVTPITSGQKVTYTTSNKRVATVSSTGVIKGIKKGTATITVKSGKKYKKIKVTVKN